MRKRHRSYKRADRPLYNYLEFKVGCNPIISDYYVSWGVSDTLTKHALLEVLTCPSTFGPRAVDIIAPLSMGIALMKMGNDKVPDCFNELLSYCREYPRMKTSVRYLALRNEVWIDPEHIPWVKEHGE